MFAPKGPDRPRHTDARLCCLFRPARAVRFLRAHRSDRETDVQNTTLLFSVECAVLARSLAPERKATPVVSVECKLFCKNTGGRGDPKLNAANTAGYKSDSAHNAKKSALRNDRWPRPSQALSVRGNARLPHRITQQLYIAAKGDHGEPQEQGTDRNQFGGHGRIFSRPQRLHAIENARQIK